MANLKELRQRQKTVLSIWRMTSAMKMVSRAKFNRTQLQWRQTKKVIAPLEALAERLKSMIHQNPPLDVSRSLFERLLDEGKDDKKAPLNLILLMTPESGMCGGFAGKQVRKVLDLVGLLKKQPEEEALGQETGGQGALISQERLQESSEQVMILTLSTKGLVALKKSLGHGWQLQGFEAFEEDQAFGEKVPSLADGVLASWPMKNVFDQMLLRWILWARENKKIQRCFVVSSAFYNVLKQEPKITDLFSGDELGITPAGLSILGLSCAQKGSMKVASPHKSQEGDQTNVSHVKNLGEWSPYGLLTCEPDLPSALEKVEDLLMHNRAQFLYIEHQLSEHAARLSTMDSAQDNAKNMLQSLKISYNHLRQSLITKELIEIISGAETVSS